MSEERLNKALKTIDRIVLFLVSHNVDEDIYPLDDITTIRETLNQISELKSDKEDALYISKELEEVKFALEVEENDNEYNCAEKDRLKKEIERLKGLYGIIDGQKIIIKELEDKVKELTELKPTAP